MKSSKISSYNWVNARILIPFWTLLAALIYLYLSTLAQTPRSSLNVMQAISVIFFVVMFFRQRRNIYYLQSKDNIEFRSMTGMFLAMLIGVFVWSFSITFYFISDDFAHIYHAQNPILRSIWDMLVHGQAKTFMRPLGFASIFLDYRIWHQWAPGYHIVNLLFHLLCVSGIYFLCKELNLNNFVAVTAAIIFAVMPANFETIAWLGARFDLLSASLSIWSIILYLKFRKSERWTQYIGALSLFILAVFSKENAYAVPLLLLIIEYLMFTERRFKPLSGFIVAAVLALGYRWLALGGIGGYMDTAGSPAVFNYGIKTVLGLFIRVPAQTLLGFNWSQSSLAFIGIVAALIASLLLLIALVVKPGYLGWKKLLFCFSWIVLSALPAHQLLFIGANLTGSRLLYLGSPGMAIYLALALSGVKLSWFRRVALFGVIILFSFAAFFNMDAWRSTSKLSQKLLTQIVKLEPSPPSNTVFIFHNMPTTVRGVFYFRVGLQEADRKSVV